ncbi:MAG: type IV pilus twitching motility protein PilT [Cyanobacteriota bacterium]|nr:type IV pilus twitching motility protein PilT [Cyanobacteriota bacterium]
MADANLPPPPFMVPRAAVPPPPAPPAIPAPALRAPVISAQAHRSTEVPTELPGELPGSLEAIVRLAHERGFSDVHLGVGEEPRYRDRGEITRTGWPVTDTATFRAWLAEMLSPAQVDSFRQEKELDSAHAFAFARVRINLMETFRGPAMVLRLIPQTILGLEDLGAPAVFRDLAARPKGMILITGPTGSGKSTTLAAIIDWINRHMGRHILTIEDPVEFVHQSHRSLVRHREVGEHTLEFHRALRAAMREDPDVILIGEIRDRDTLATAIEASQTGHLVFGTLHTNSAIKTVERILGMFPAADQEAIRRATAESLLAVIAQGLLRSTDGRRVAFHDIMVNTDACKDYILSGKLEDIEEIMARSAFDGMQTANQALLELVSSGRVRAEDALAQSLKPNELAQALRGRT